MALREILSLAYSMNLDPNNRSYRKQPIERWLEVVEGDLPNAAEKLKV